MGLANRAIVCVVAVALGVDMLVQSIAVAPAYLLFGVLKPNPRRSISGLMGWASARGYRWGIIGAAWIDGIFGRGHCASCATFEDPFNRELSA